MMMTQLINQSIDASVAVMSNPRGSAFLIWFPNCCLSSFGSKVICGELILSVSQYSSLSRSFHKSIAALLIVVYSAVAGVVLKGNHLQRQTSLSTFSIQVNAVVAFAWIWRQDVYRSVFLIKICSVGYLFRISDIMWSILSNQNP